jgi:hypothetical protein
MNAIDKAEALAKKATLLRVAIEGLAMAAHDGLFICEEDIEVVCDLAMEVEGALRPDKHEEKAAA